MIQPNENGYLSVMSISTSIFGEAPISSLKLNVSLYLYNISMICFFSGSDRQDISKFTYFPIFSYLTYVSFHCLGLTMDICPSFLPVLSLTCL